MIKQKSLRLLKGSGIFRWRGGCQGNLRKNRNISSTIFAYSISPRMGHEVPSAVSCGGGRGRVNTSESVFPSLLFAQGKEAPSAGEPRVRARGRPRRPPRCLPRPRSSRGLLTPGHSDFGKTMKTLVFEIALILLLPPSRSLFLRGIEGIKPPPPHASH